MHGDLHIGTSGWSYAGWKDGFFSNIPRKEWLHHYAGRFTTVEVNATFYRQLRPSTFEHWRQQTPAGFKFAIKGHRYLTHVSKLLCVSDALTRQQDAAMSLRDKLAVVVWQMPPSLKLDLPRLDAFADALRNWSEVRHALEFRDGSWFCPETADRLRRHHLAVCQSDSADWPLWQEVTTDLVYVRLHGHERTYVSAYTNFQLESWADRIRVWLAQNRQVYVYFDNTDAGHAPENATHLVALLS